MLVGRSQPEKNAPPKNIIFASFPLPTQQRHTASRCDCEQRANFRAARNPLSLKARRQKSLAAWHLENSEYVVSQIFSKLTRCRTFLEENESKIPYFH